MSVLALVLSPMEHTVERIRVVGPWVGLGLVVSEALFLAGLAALASAVGVRLGRNPLRWRHQLRPALASLHRSTLFWAGLAVNTLGAVGSAVVVGAGIVAGLPVASWGLLALPAGDLALTAAVRAAVMTGVSRRGADDRDHS